MYLCVIWLPRIFNILFHKLLHRLREIFCKRYHPRILLKFGTDFKQNIKIAVQLRRSPYVFLGKGVLKICRKFTGEHSCQSAISIKLQSKFIEIALRHGCSPVNLLHILRTPFAKNTSGILLLPVVLCMIHHYNIK